MAPELPLTDLCTVLLCALLTLNFHYSYTPRSRRSRTIPSFSLSCACMRNMYTLGFNWGWMSASDDCSVCELAFELRTPTPLASSQWGFCPWEKSVNLCGGQTNLVGDVLRRWARQRQSRKSTPATHVLSCDRGDSWGDIPQWPTDIYPR